MTTMKCVTTLWGDPQRLGRIARSWGHYYNRPLPWGLVTLLYGTGSMHEISGGGCRVAEDGGWAVIMPTADGAYTVVMERVVEPISGLEELVGEWSYDRGSWLDKGKPVGHLNYCSGLQPTTDPLKP